MDGLEIGAVLTSAELDGVAPTADWARWVEPDQGAGFTDNWRDDLSQLAGLGVSAVALTAEWARLQPQPGGHDQAEIELLIDRLTTATDLGLTPWLCLVDGTLPGWFADDSGGFVDDQARGLIWPRHIDWVGETFGDLVAGWIPQREPIQWAVRRYLLGSAPPGRRDLVAAGDAVEATMLADREAWRLLAGTAPVAAYHTARLIRASPTANRDGVRSQDTARPQDTDHRQDPARPQDTVAAQGQAALVERLMWHPWLSMLGEGRLVVGDRAERVMPEMVSAFDRVIVELRAPLLIDQHGRWTTDRPRPELLAEGLHRALDELSDRELVAAGSPVGVADDGRARADQQHALVSAAVDAERSTGLVGWWQSSPIAGVGLSHTTDLDRSGPGRQPAIIDRSRNLNLVAPFSLSSA